MLPAGVDLVAGCSERTQGRFVVVDHDGEVPALGLCVVGEQEMNLGSSSLEPQRAAHETVGLRHLGEAEKGVEIEA